MTKNPIEIPKTFMGVSTEEAYRRILEEPEKKANVSDNQLVQLGNPNITKKDYIQIPGINRVISRFEVQGYNNMNWDNTHFKLHENGLYMPTPAVFMKHFMNVVEAHKSNGQKTLFDAAGNPISKKDLEDIYLHLTKDHIAVYGNQAGAWTWLDAKFEEGKILSEHRTKRNGRDKILHPNKVESLEAALTEDCIADLEFNTQGLAVKKSKKQKYVAGKNLYFYYPRENLVAGFYAYSDRAFLDCDWVPVDSDSDLGVFAVTDVS